ncbi:hypothetical protein [Pseudovibrio sp. Tun.PSC04-5.I4]|uniref:hypothetical protein n=1 Tax=Pseudovibrio sp. Tun.PSC04-5.I4 TaxID=1798213 RepID=UPI000881A09D|nr:hypothetical protein [Pseudovibrio sp. Tun.PSC04-5.I4]SDR07983.1 hypothetical protein SAMN04515695_2647 [Pseudovibrio sp. Tun.PSC04-5.I4]
MARYRVELKSTILIDIDESKFTEEFMEQYRELIDPSFREVRDHAGLLAEFALGGIAENGDFVEGYGDLNQQGIKFVDLPQVETEAILRDGEHI